MDMNTDPNATPATPVDGEEEVKPEGMAQEGDMPMPEEKKDGEEEVAA